MLPNPESDERTQSRHGKEFSQGYYKNTLLMFILCTHVVITSKHGFQIVMHIVMRLLTFKVQGLHHIV
jgi:hypothetical protein